MNVLNLILEVLQFILGHIKTTSTDPTITAQADAHTASLEAAKSKTGE